ncbi:MAG: hypothetical protein ACYS32_01050 [Planctomycetota bacterium]|jgi:hypothetical protein
MAKNKSGLHKGISSIFSGIPIPKKDGDAQQSPTATQETQTYGPPSHLSKNTAESSPILKSLMKEPPAETPKPDEKTPAAPAPAPAAPAPVIKIKRARPAWLEQIQHLIQDKFFAPQPGVSPARQKATVVLVPIMFIGMILAFYKVLGGGPGKVTEPKVITPSNAIAASAGTINWQIPEAYPTTLRDPMQFKTVPPPPDANETEPKTEDIDIKGILYSEQDPSAIIGTEIIHEGGTVSGATVVKINKDSVEFERDGERWTQKVE